MSDERDTVLPECGYYARFGAAEDSPMERSGFFPDGGCNYLDNFCLSISTSAFV